MKKKITFTVAILLSLLGVIFTYNSSIFLSWPRVTCTDRKLYMEYDLTYNYRYGEKRDNTNEYNRVSFDNYTQLELQSLHNIITLHDTTVQQKEQQTQLFQQKQVFSSNATIHDNKNTIHVVVSLDEREVEGLLALLESIKSHASKDVIVHVVTNSSFYSNMSQVLLCSFPSAKNFQINVIEFDIPEEMDQLIVVRGEDKQYLADPANFARFYFFKIFPNLTRIIYLDVDTIVRHDISEMWKKMSDSKKLLLAVPRRDIIPKRKSHGYHHFTNVTESLYRKRHNKRLKGSVTYFNAGVVGINLKKWRDNNIIDEVLYWMKMNKIADEPLWHLGTQIIMQLIAINDWEKLDRRWNVDSLGGYTPVSKNRLSKAYILHWSGAKKPWMTNGRHYDLWKKYQKKIILDC